MSSEIINTRSVLFVFGSAQAYGAQKVGVGMARGMASQGLSVVVIHPPEVSGDVPSILPLLGHERILLIEERGLEKTVSMAGIIRALRITRRIRPFVIVSFIQRAMRLSAPLSKLSGVPLVISIQNPAGASGTGWIQNLKRRYYGWVVRDVARLNFCTSQTLQGHLVDDFGVTEDRTRLLANGIDVRAQESSLGVNGSAIRKEFGISADDFVFCFVGRLAWQKGIEFIIEAFENTVEHHSRARLLIVGAPKKGLATAESYAEERRKQADQSKAGERITFAGWRNDAADIIGESHCYIQASRFEGPAAPLPVIEAMVRSKPVIISNCSGDPPGFEQGREGYVTPVGDVAELTRRMTEMLTLTTEAYARMGEAVRQLAWREFDEEKIARSFLTTLSQEFSEKSDGGKRPC